MLSRADLKCLERDDALRGAITTLGSTANRARHPPPHGILGLPLSSGLWKKGSWVTLEVKSTQGSDAFIPTRPQLPAELLK